MFHLLLWLEYRSNKIYLSFSVPSVCSKVAESATSFTINLDSGGSLVLHPHYLQLLELLFLPLFLVHHDPGGSCFFHALVFCLLFFCF